MMCFVLDFGLLKPASNPIFGDSSNFPTCCQLVVVKKKMSRFPSLLKKNSERKSCCFSRLFPPKCVAGEKKKQSSETPQDLMFDLKKLYIYISSLKLTAKAPGNSNGWKMMKFPFGLKGPFSGAICAVSFREGIYPSQHPPNPLGFRKTSLRKKPPALDTSGSSWQSRLGVLDMLGESSFLVCRFLNMHTYIDI